MLSILHFVARPPPPHTPTHTPTHPHTHTHTHVVVDLCSTSWRAPRCLQSMQGGPGAFGPTWSPGVGRGAQAITAKGSAAAAVMGSVMAVGQLR